MIVRVVEAEFARPLFCIAANVAGENLSRGGGLPKIKLPVYPLLTLLERWVAEEDPAVWPIIVLPCLISNERWVRKTRTIMRHDVPVHASRKVCVFPEKDVGNVASTNQVAGIAAWVDCRPQLVQRIDDRPRSW